MRLIHPENLAIVTIWMEARGESFEGKVAVAEVIRNRTMQKHYSDGAMDSTVLWPFQFSGWNTGDRSRTTALRLDDDDPMFLECRRALDLAMNGSDTVEGAINYYSVSMSSPPSWSESMTFVCQVGRHRFYK